MFAQVIGNLKSNAEQAIKQQPEDYRGGNGLLMCGKCRTAKEIEIEVKELNIKSVVRCLCKCEKEKDDREQAEFKARQEQIEINRLRCVGIQDKKIIAYTFSNDDGSNPKISDLARRYVDKFEEMKKNNCGLLLYGDTGTGKSFFAGCIGNALIDNGVSVLATSITRLINQLFNAENKNALLRDICSYDLLIIDDLGAERSTDYAIEQVYTVIDERYKSNRPIICTTNEEPEKIANAPDVQHKRIYDRILEMCTPVKVEGQRRKAAGQEKARKLAEILYSN